MKFKDRCKKSFIEFSRGRYGIDQLNRLLQFVSMVLLLFGIIKQKQALVIVSLILILVVNFRTFSRNIPARYKENQFYLNTTRPIRKRGNVAYKQIKDWKTYRYVFCPHCDEPLRLPKNKGKIRVTCPHCKYKFEKRV